MPHIAAPSACGHHRTGDRRTGRNSSSETTRRGSRGCGVDRSLQMQRFHGFVLLSDRGAPRHFPATAAGRTSLSRTTAATSSDRSTWPYRPTRTHRGGFNIASDAELDDRQLNLIMGHAQRGGNVLAVAQSDARHALSHTQYVTAARTPTSSWKRPTASRCIWMVSYLRSDARRLEISVARRLTVLGAPAG